MKDKIIRYNRKKPYYVMRAFLIAFGAFLLLFAAVSIPLGVSYSLYANANDQQTGLKTPNEQTKEIHTSIS